MSTAFSVLPGGVIAERRVEDLPGAHQILQRAQRFLDRGRWVLLVQIEDLDAVGLQPPQALFGSASRWGGGRARAH